MVVSRLARFTISLVAVLVLFQSACTGGGWNVDSRQVDPALTEIARAIINSLASNEIDSARALFRGDVRADISLTALNAEAEPIIGERIDSMILIGVATRRSPEETEVTLTYLLEVEDGRYGAALAMVPTSMPPVIGLNIEPFEVSMDQTSGFSLIGKSVFHYVWLLLLPLVAAICIWTAYAVLTSTDIGRKWTWAIVSLITAPTLILNWATGEVEIGPGALLGIIVMQPAPWAPWMIGFGIPIGAVAAMVKLRVGRDKDSG